MRPHALVLCTGAECKGQGSSAQSTDGCHTEAAPARSPGQLHHSIWSQLQSMGATQWVLCRLTAPLTPTSDAHGVVERLGGRGAGADWGVGAAGVRLP